jgi:Glycosyl hydrolase family 10
VAFLPELRLAAAGAVSLEAGEDGMGVMRFLVRPIELLQNWPEIYRAYVTGFDRHVFPTRVELDGDILTCRRPLSDSGKLHITFPVDNFGRPVLSTSSLPEREEPYLLPLELARGRISQLRDQASHWELARMMIPDEFRSAEKRAFRCFAQATTARDDLNRAAQLSCQALQEACAASEILMRAYTRQRLEASRHPAISPLASLGCLLAELPDEASQKLFASTFQAVVIPLEWTQIEPREGNYDWSRCDELIDFAIQERLIIRAGPLINFSSGGLPSWLAQWEHDVLNLQSFLCDFVQTTVSRYQGRIRLWEVSAYGNSGGALGINEENRLGLVARTLESALKNDDDAQLFIRVDQPWGDYQARGHHRLSPFQFVDAIARSNLGLAGVNLEFSIGYCPRGCCSRDLLEFSRLIDHWSMLGVQLHVTLAFPSSAEPDPAAEGDLDVEPSVWRKPCSEETQARWIENYVPLLMAKPAVTGVYWSHFSDAQRHRLPHAGLLRPDGTTKPALDMIGRFSHR